MIIELRLYDAVLVQKTIYSYHFGILVCEFGSLSASLSREVSSQVNSGIVMCD
jgi:hypothetical protein